MEWLVLAKKIIFCVCVCVYVSERNQRGVSVVNGGRNLLYTLGHNHRLIEMKSGVEFGNGNNEYL